jgi:hypothetical protein
VEDIGRLFNNQVEKDFPYSIHFTITAQCIFKKVGEEGF